ncbi:hypothetical protein KTO58_01130 [Chitinophaga pendula]|uniref:hypothetical protein n=1 Tax=Chitinophaga TaxID=79328 RepID=UPI000BB0199C|nr:MULTISPECIES: hypothetical protein [Chitinophaga]ASZ14539.1 hypothetical protein CK934_28110 [Chitinophaga sp. MD30]UCJ07808.1 hypothetical protein KTO58_01130 [Chitinophaga pendula]
MNNKDTLNELVNTVKAWAKSQGQRLTVDDIAGRMHITRTYLSGLLGGSKEVTKKHVLDFRSHFKQELLLAAGIESNDKISRERALLLALVHDYTERMALLEGVSEETVKSRIKAKSRLILDDFDSWF